jgi:tetratricopeptide (TPR) repeat protein
MISRKLKTSFYCLVLAVVTISSITNSQDEIKINLLIKKIKSVKDTALVNVYNSLASEYLISGDSLVKVYSSKAIELSRRISYQKGLIEASIILGDYYSSRGEYFSALEYLNYSLAASQELNDRKLTASVYIKLGRIEELKNNLILALTNAEKTLTIFRTIEDKKGIAESLNKLGYYHFKLNNKSAALKYLLEAYNISSKIQLNEAIKESAFMLSEVYLALNKYEKSYEYYKIYSNIKELIFKSNKSEEIGRVEARYEIQKKIEKEKREEAERIAREETERTRISNLQYFISTSLVIVVFLSIFFMKKRAFNPRIIEGFVFLSFLLFFQFISVLLDPITDKFTGGFPLPKLIINGLLALSLTYLDKFFEDKLMKRVKNNSPKVK